MIRTLPICNTNIYCGSSECDNIINLTIEFYHDNVSIISQTKKYIPLTTANFQLNGQTVTILDVDGYEIASYTYPITYHISSVQLSYFENKIYVYATSIETMILNLFQNSAENNRLNKFPYLTNYSNLNGTLKNSCSIIEPIITISHNGFIESNYCYIPLFKRYYFITDVVSVSLNIWELRLNCDVLMSFGNDILNLTAIVSRQEFLHNNLLTDNRVICQNDLNVRIIYADKDPFDGDSIRKEDNGNYYVIQTYGVRNLI